MKMDDRYAEEPLTLLPRSGGTASAGGQPNVGSALGSPTLPFTGERIVPGQVSEPLFREHEARYVFASGFVKDQVVLDVACGVGIGTHYLLEAGAQSCLGLDIDGPAVYYASAEYNGCDFKVCDALNLCVPDSSIGVVVSFETIEHVKNPVRFLSECNRVLKPGGVLVCSTPNRTMSRWAPANPYHLQEFTVAEFRRALESIFIDVQLFGQEYLNQMLYAGQRLLSRALHAVHLMDAAKSIFGKRPALTVMPTEFGGMPKGSEFEVLPYEKAQLVAPRYVIAVARKSH